jgi:hypothetical protein
MSWTYDFGVVNNADELREHKPKLNIEARSFEAPVNPADQVSEKEVRRLNTEFTRATAKAIAEHVAAVRDAAATVIESKPFGSSPVSVFASGQANPDHAVIEPTSKPIEVDGVVVDDGNTIGAVEHITITLTQVRTDA